MDMRPAAGDGQLPALAAVAGPLFVETARRVLDYTGGTLVMPMTVLHEQYWREVSTWPGPQGDPQPELLLPGGGIAREAGPRRLGHGGGAAALLGSVDPTLW